MKKLDENKKIELKLFLTELEKLTTRYHFIIDGCGCCGSPCIRDLTDSNYSKIAENLEYNDIEKRYKITGEF